VGSVGTLCWIVLMGAGDGTEPLFLQPKEAVASALAAYCGRSHYASHGERVVAGQHLMQADICATGSSWPSLTSVLVNAKFGLPASARTDHSYPLPSS
jgi:uncharacterized protein (DUF2252 family)